MKKLFLLLAVFGLLFTACESGGDDVTGGDNTEQPGGGNNDDGNDEPQNPTEQPDGGNDDNGNDDSGNDDGGNDNPTIEDPIFKIDSDGNYIVEAEGGVVSVRVTTNLEYSVNIPEDAKSWLSVADTRAVRNETLTFIVAKNEVSGERQATVKIKDANEEIVQNIVFKQKDESTGGPISVSKGRVSFDFEGGECELTVDAEYSWVATCPADWVTLQTPDGIAGEEPLKFIVRRNTALSERKATITLKNENYNLIQEVYVIQTEFAPIIEVVESVSLVDVACEKFINVTSNVEYDVTDNADWLTCESVEGGVNLSATANNAIETRSATVTITAKENPEAPASKLSVVQVSIDARRAIYYTSSDGNVVEPHTKNVFGANIVSNTYENGQGIIFFDKYITSIGDAAFWDCSTLTSITIPESVTEIGDRAFVRCTLLTSFYGKFASSDNRCLIIDGVLLAFARANLTLYTIPDGVTSIGDTAFWDCYTLTSITIPDSVTSIGSSAFYGCSSLTSVNIPDSVISIGSYAFGSCTSLANVTIGNSVTSIGSRAFSDCTGELIINSKIVETDTTYSYPAWLYGSKFTILTIGDSVTKIGSYVFSGYTSLKRVTIPESVTEIGDRAFECCTGELIINSKIIETNYEPSNCPTHFGWLYGYEFTELTIGDSVTSIGRCAFYYCTSLEDVTIPDSVTSIGDRAFNNCYSLCDVYCKPTTPPTGGYGMFSSSNSFFFIFVPRNSVSAYKSKWSEYASDIRGYDFN